MCDKYPIILQKLSLYCKVKETIFSNLLSGTYFVINARGKKTYYRNEIEINEFIDYLLGEYNLDLDRLDMVILCDTFPLNKIYDYITQVTIEKEKIVFTTKIKNTKIIFNVYNLLAHDILNNIPNVKLVINNVLIKNLKSDKLQISCLTHIGEIDHDFLSQFRESLTKLTIDIRFGDGHDYLVFPNLIFLNISTQLTKSSAYGYINPCITTFLKNNKSIEILRLDTTYVLMNLLDYLIHNTHIKQFTCNYSFSGCDVEKIIYNNTTLQRLHVGVHGTFNIKTIPPNYKFLKFKGTVNIDLNAILKSNCHYIDASSIMSTIIDCNSISIIVRIYNYNYPCVSSNAIIDCLKKNSNHMGLLNFGKQLHLDSVKKMCKQLIIPNTTLLMYLLYGKYFV